MSSFNSIDFNKLDIPYINMIGDKTSIRFFYKENNIHDDIILKLGPCLCPYGIKTFNNITILTCSLANFSRKRIKEIKTFEQKVESKFYKSYPQYKKYKLRSFIDDQYRYSLSVNPNDIRVFDQKLNLIQNDSIRPQSIIEPAICLYEIWIKREEEIWGINCKLLQCKVFSHFVAPNYCLFNKNISNIDNSDQVDKIEKMKKVGVPQDAIEHYKKKNNIICNEPIMPKLNFTANDLLAVKLKPVEDKKEKIQSEDNKPVFRPPSVNDLLSVKLKPVTVKKEKNIPEKPKKPGIFRPPSVNELLEMKKKLKKTPD